MAFIHYQTMARRRRTTAKPEVQVSSQLRKLSVTTDKCHVANYLQMKRQKATSLLVHAMVSLASPLASALLGKCSKYEGLKKSCVEEINRTMIVLEATKWLQSCLGQLVEGRKLGLQ